VAVVSISAIATSNRSGSGVSVRTEAVAARDLVATVTASGWIRPHRRVDVQADIMGRIIELNVKEGQPSARPGPAAHRPGAVRGGGRAGAGGVSEALRARRRRGRTCCRRSAPTSGCGSSATSDQNLVSRQQIEEAETQVRVQRELLTAAGFGVRRRAPPSTRRATACRRP
jgi:HlyD family secretion protein